jgi:hypothetical protein
MAKITATIQAVKNGLNELGYDEEHEDLAVRETYRRGKQAIYISMMVEFSSTAKPVTMYADADDDPEEIVDRFMELVRAEEDRLRAEAQDAARTLHASVIRSLVQYGHAEVAILRPEEWRLRSTFIVGDKLITSVRVMARTTSAYDHAEASTPLAELPPAALKALARSAIKATAEAGAALHAIAIAAGKAEWSTVLSWYGQKPHNLGVTLTLGADTASTEVDATWQIPEQLDELIRVV